MFKKYCFLILGILFLSEIQANNILPTPSSQVNLPEEYSCNLPAPASVSIEEIGPTWAKITWVAATPNVEHRIRTYKSNGNILVSTIITPAGQLSTFVWGLVENETYYTIVNAICKNGENSPYGITTPEYTTITDELVVSGFTPLNNPRAVCWITSTSLYPNDRCALQSGVTSTFRIIQTNAPFNQRQFQASSNGGLLTVQMDASNEGQGLFYRIQIDDHDPNFHGSLYQIKLMNNQNPIATFRIFKDDSNNYFLRRQSMDSLYEIQRIIPCTGCLQSGSSGSSTGFSTERTASTTSSHPAIASPNPFSESLDVFPGNLYAENIHFQLYNLSGQKVLDQQFPGGQEQYSLSTASLSPGFYMLRIEADGEVQTLKVVKSE